MINLIIKDFPIRKRLALDILVSCLVGNLLFIEAPAFIYILVPSVLVYGHILNSCTYNDRYNGDVMFNSLPVTRKEVVLSKYAGSFVILILSVGATLIFTYLFRALNVSGAAVSSFIHLNKMIHLDQINGLMNIKGTLSSCATTIIIMIAIYFPIYFRFEFKDVKNVFVLVLYLLWVIPFFLIKLIGAYNISRAVMYLNNMNTVILGILLAAALFILIYISINLSIKFYTSRDI
ncbi:ABC-2 transporter permease [Clostridium oryzae]|uniref:ABC-2 family transporter protein n=1 Tax=Clostridium oryzae TaxID=1450648 RepID=A0A1V4IVS5_9CLOT|nr:ABC-2 transporter permease [Clostridium oryzae]OPJ64132.1 hypothetical protein CLORY_06790 [Clostridium oryzae]